MIYWIFNCDYAIFRLNITCWDILLVSGLTSIAQQQSPLMGKTTWTFERLTQISNPSVL